MKTRHGRFERRDALSSVIAGSMTQWLLASSGMWGCLCHPPRAAAR